MIIVVFHRLTPIELVAEICRSHVDNEILLLSSHFLFSQEREFVSTLCPSSHIIFKSFSDFLDDQALSEIDACALKDVSTKHERPERYSEAYYIRMMELKNEALLRVVLMKYQGVRLYVQGGLGVYSKVWLRAGAIKLRHDYRPRRNLFQVIALVYKRILDELFSRAECYSVRTRIGHLLFTCKPRRVHTDPSLVFNSISDESKDLASGFDAVATTMHQYTPAVRQLGLPIFILVDGHLPSNYPESFLGAYGNATFISSDLSSTAWLRNCGRPCLCGKGLIQPLYFARPKTTVQIRTVCLMLNHSGDWAALINRSDTDILVQAFFDLSVRLPGLRYILRTHPGADHPRHEGPGAIARIRNACGRVSPAIEFSNVSLSEDLDRGDVFLSEYSATLIDAWAMGKLGVAVNLTGRRSLMADYTSLGFPECDSLEQLVQLLTVMVDSPPKALAKQYAAVERYNQALAQIMGSSL